MTHSVCVIGVPGQRKTKQQVRKTKREKTAVKSAKIKVIGTPVVFTTNSVIGGCLPGGLELH